MRISQYQTNDVTNYFKYFIVFLSKIFMMTFVIILFVGKNLSNF